VFRVGFTAASQCDINFDGATNVLDVQRMVNVVLGATSAGNEDLNHDTSVNVLDVQALVHY
jgi:hypothetical protein